MDRAVKYRYSVERDSWGAAHAVVALVRRPPGQGVLGARQGRGEATIMFRRTFRPRVQLEELERYAAELERVAKHANAGTFGCFVDTRSRDGIVEVSLYERWFDGRQLRCEQLASREFDPDDEHTLVASAEFVAQLEAWAEARNDERDWSYVERAIEEHAREQRALERQSAADELARILAPRRAGR
jgi:hypothetical protein